MHHRQQSALHSQTERKQTETEISSQFWLKVHLYCTLLEIEKGMPRRYKFLSEIEFIFIYNHQISLLSAHRCDRHSNNNKKSARVCVHVHVCVCIHVLCACITFYQIIWIQLQYKISTVIKVDKLVALSSHHPCCLPPEGEPQAECKTRQCRTGL